jgi:hypothetical protein
MSMASCDSLVKTCSSGERVTEVRNNGVLGPWCHHLQLVRRLQPNKIVTNTGTASGGCCLTPSALVNLSSLHPPSGPRQRLVITTMFQRGRLGPEGCVTPCDHGQGPPNSHAPAPLPPSQGSPRPGTQKHLYHPRTLTRNSTCTSPEHLCVTVQ